MSKSPTTALTKSSASVAVPAKSDPDKSEKAKDVFRVVCGSASRPFNTHLLLAAASAAWHPKGEPHEGQQQTVDAVIIAMTAFRPADEIEGMIAAQAVAMHHASMEWSRRAMIPDQGFEPAREYRKAAANASRAFVELLSALDRKRGKGGQQKVTVEHVHVHAGGKAIVGTVETGSPTGGGGGAQGKAWGEPRASPAALEHDAAAGTVLPALRCADPEREAVPVASDAERPLPDARRG
jgi:hypothetical protein